MWHGYSCDLGMLSPCVDFDLAALTRCTALRTRSSLKLFSPTRNFTSPSSSAAIHFSGGTCSPLRTLGSAPRDASLSEQLQGRSQQDKAMGSI